SVNVVAARATDQNSRTVIYDGVATEVSAAPEPSSDLWITTTDLTRATRFVIKPQGVCRNELCFPLPKNRKAEFVSKKGGTSWFNLTEFARLIKQSFSSIGRTVSGILAPARLNRTVTSAH